MVQEKKYFSPQGTLVRSREEAVATAAVAGATNTACLELRNGSVQFIIEVTFDPNTSPFLITGGQITGSICGSPWEVIGGSMGSTLRIEAEGQDTPGCANTIIIVGNYQMPSSWSGTYGFNGNSTSFRHTTLFRGYSPC
ncbi:MAG: hypothetical protein F6K36_29470 [Symploca sp. SIO3C6]|nr:hypothetical protein [Symploca sp. SIO3C6]